MEHISSDKQKHYHNIQHISQYNNYIQYKSINYAIDYDNLFDIKINHNDVCYFANYHNYIQHITINDYHVSNVTHYISQHYYDIQYVKIDDHYVCDFS